MFDMQPFARGVLAFLLVAAIDAVATHPTFGHPEAHLAGGLDFGGGAQEAHALAGDDHHGGVSIVGAGGSAHRGITIDLTKHAGGDHTGLFGGSFIAAGSHGKSGEHHHHAALSEHVDAGLGSYASALTSYDAGGVGGGAHDAGETSPVLYSSFKAADHDHALHSGGGFDHAHFGGGGGGHFEHLGAGFHH